MRDSVFTYWTAGADELPLGWDEALRRLAARRTDAQP
jgi:hypothetical protein